MATQGATPEEVEEFARDLPDAYLLCRELGHTWRPWRASRNPWGWDRTLRCQRCTSLRLQTLDTRGSIVKSHYDYSEGYLHQHLGRIMGEGRDVVRLESVLRLVENRMTTKVVDRSTETAVERTLKPRKAAS